MGVRLSGRRLWFQIHKWIGLLLFLILIPLSASGSLLVWHDWTDSLVNPQRYAVEGASASLPAARYVSAARVVLAPDDRIASIEYPHSAGSPVVLSAAPVPRPGAKVRPGPPPRYQVWLDPSNARVLDHADGRSGLVRVLHVFHGSLMVPGIGRTIVGWLGVLMLVSCLTGIWLWWPTVGSVWRGFRWNRGPRISGNLHHQVGIWIALPLALLSFTGAYISFPTFFRGVETIASTASSPDKVGRPPDRRAPPVAAPRLAVDEAIAAARRSANLTDIVTIRWPTEASGKWTIGFDRGGERADIEVGDRDGAVESARSGGSQVARLMRQLHDGTGYNPFYQTIIFVAGLLPALLGITGVIMWLRTRGWRAAIAFRQKRRRAVAV